MYYNIRISCGLICFLWYILHWNVFFIKRRLLKSIKAIFPSMSAGIPPSHHQRSLILVETKEMSSDGHTPNIRQLSIYATVFRWPLWSTLPCRRRSRAIRRWSQGSLRPFLSTVLQIWSKQRSRRIRKLEGMTYGFLCVTSLPLFITHSHTPFRFAHLHPSSFFFFYHPHSYPFRFVHYNHSTVYHTHMPLRVKPIHCFIIP